ncbi:MAG: hypothetical protein CMJ94_05710 [Planctomycetes bacterium]|nr:hypothetical protein [Planctomycetota bacterium]
METVLEVLASAPALATFGLLLMCGLGLPPWSEEIVILASGYFVAEGALSYQEAVFWCFAGILAGDSIIYALGAWVGEGVYHWPVLRSHMKARHRNKFNRLFFRHGTLAVFLARFLPGFRMVAYFVAGNLGMRYWKFVLLDSIGAVVTVPISVYAGFMLAEHLDKAQAMLHKYQIPVLILGVAVLLLALRIRRNRRIARFDQLQRERTERHHARAARGRSKSSKEASGTE